MTIQNGYYRIAQNFDGGKVWWNLTNQACQKFDKQNFDELIVAVIGKVLTGKRLEGKTLTNHLPFVKFRRLFHRQSFALYSTWFNSCLIFISALSINTDIRYIHLQLAMGIHKGENQKWGCIINKRMFLSEHIWVKIDWSCFSIITWLLVNYIQQLVTHVQ